MVSSITYTLAFMLACMMCLVSAQDSLLWPVAFKKSCNVAEQTDQYLRNIIQEYNRQGFQCSSDSYSAFIVNSPCATVNVVEGILWPIEFQKLQDMFRKLYAGVNCVTELMTGQSYS